MRLIRPAERWEALALVQALLALGSCAPSRQEAEVTMCRAAPAVFWEAHRGGGMREAPDNTVAAFEHAWRLGGIPEVDLRTTADGVIICLHDRTLARTTDAPANLANRPVRTLSYDEINEWDAGVKFGPGFRGSRVPALAEVFALMRGHPERQLYMDLKQVDLARLAALVAANDVVAQLIIASPSHDECAEVKAHMEEVRTLLWLGGPPHVILRRFEEAAANGFVGLDQVQLHLDDKRPPQSWRYHFEPDLLRWALYLTGKYDVDLEVFVKWFDTASLHALLDLGIRWYVTDEPGYFTSTVAAWQRRVSYAPE